MRAQPATGIPRAFPGVFCLFVSCKYCQLEVLSVVSIATPPPRSRPQRRGLCNLGLHDSDDKQYSVYLRERDGDGGGWVLPVSVALRD